MEPDGWDPSGEPVVTYATAGAHLRTNRDEVAKLVKDGSLTAASCEDRAAKSAGRPPSKFVLLSDVVRLRTASLRALGACDEGVERERDQLRDEVADLRERLATAEATEIHGELLELRRALAQGQDRANRLHAALEAGVAADRAHLDQISNLLLPTGVWPDPGLSTEPSPRSG